MQASVFDLDHTLVKGNCSYHFGSYLYRRGFFGFSKLCLCLSAYGRHKCLGMSLQSLHNHCFRQLFQGRSFVEVQAYANAFLDEKLESLLYLPVLTRLKDAQARGDAIALLSSGPDFVVSAIASRLNIENWRATTYLRDTRGHFLEICQVMEGNLKADFMHRWSQELNIPLTSFAVYSDSYLDLPALLIAGRPIGVQPDARLKRLCLKNQWETL